MIRRGLGMEGGLAAVAVMALVALGGASLKASFERQKQFALRRLQKSSAFLIEHAWHIKDDLMIQEAVSGLGKAPGIGFACVVANDGTLIAHSQPSQLGLPFHRPSLPSAAWPLYEEQKQWGTLVLALSDKNLREAWLRELGCGCLAGVLLWLVWMARYGFWSRRLAERDHQISDLSSLMEEEKQKLTRVLTDHRQAEERWRLWLRESFNQFNGAMALLDHRQKLVGMNLAAAQALKIVSPEVLIGKSWQELPGVQDLGEALQNSLNAPGVLIGQLLPGNFPLAFLTICDAAGVSAGTWIVSSSKPSSS